MHALMGMLGNPQREIPAIHVTGTNGKGSTSRMLVGLIAATGLDVGSYTSPHLDTVNDRIMIANQAIDDVSSPSTLRNSHEPWVIEATGEFPSCFEVMQRPQLVCCQRSRRQRHRSRHGWQWDNQRR